MFLRLFWLIIELTRLRSSDLQFNFVLPICLVKLHEFPVDKIFEAELFFVNKMFLSASTQIKVMLLNIRNPSFLQMCLGLRYLHCDKRIVHRDLTPNNVMLGENDKVTISEFAIHAL